MLFTPIAYGDSSLSKHRLGSGDTIDIRVFNESKLSVKTTLTDTGTISFPLLGELKISGMTVGELEDFLVDQLKGEDKYLINPKVTVSISKYRTIFVTGEVNKPGSYTYIPGLTVRKAISLAGGFTRRASMKKIYRNNDGDHRDRQNKVSLNDLINAGDTITVEESFF
ncbi:MAG: polysaccharide export protein [Magnetococcales bacterium]|nr:polysaccharide export protein [Magnetococcales bacterium]